MFIEVKEIDYCRLNVKFEADPQQVEDKRAEIVQYFKRGNVPGFRPGKATVDAVKHHFNARIQELMKSELAQAAFSAAIAEKNIRPFGQPQFLSVHLEGSKFKCDFCVNKIPEVELKQYKEFDLPKGHIPDAVEMAERILQELRTRNGETIPFSENDFIQTGDTAIMNYEGRLEGDEHPVIKQDGEIFVVGKADLEAFNENLLGMKVGERREFGQMMPETASPKVSGKLVNFTVEVVMASRSEPCPLDDTLAEKIGAKDVADLIAMTQGMASKRVQDLQSKYLSEQVAKRLVEGHELNIPDWLASFEAQLLARQYGSSWENLADKDKNNFIDFATKNVKLSIILDKIRETEPDAQLSDEEVIKLIRTNISQYKSNIPGMSGLSDEEALEKISQSGYISALVSTVRDDFTLDFIIKNSNIVE